MSEINNVIEFRNAYKDYGDFKLDNISFAVPKGSVCSKLISMLLFLWIWL